MKTQEQFLQELWLEFSDQKTVLQQLPDLWILLRTEWSEIFESLMRHRLVMGAFRYGRLHDQNKPQYNRIKSIYKRLKNYQQTGNTEMLVDIANLCLMEFEEGEHTNKHFKADQVIHVEKI